MNQKNSQERLPATFSLSEDWLSVIIGLAVVLVVALVSLFSHTTIPWPLFGVFS